VIGKKKQHGKKTIKDGKKTIRDFTKIEHGRIKKFNIRTVLEIWFHSSEKGCSPHSFFRSAGYVSFISKSESSAARLRHDYRDGVFDSLPSAGFDLCSGIAMASNLGANSPCR
jgi:hypothetical protein